MFKNYLLIALQEIRKMPVFSAVKILSLAIGLSCSILVIMHVQYANSFDKHFPDWENTYRLVSSFGIDPRLNTELSSEPWAPQLQLDYPEIEYIAKIRRGEALLTNGSESYNEEYYWAEQDFLRIFALDFISGNPETALDEPYSVILSESIANKYFPEGNALGSTLTADQQINVTVAGVYRDLPENTHIHPRIISGLNTARQILGENFMRNNFWFSFQGSSTYLTIPDRDDAVRISNDMNDFLYRNIPDDTRDAALRANLEIYLENIGDIYLSEFVGFGGSNPRPKIILGLAIFAALILVTSCINFANLSLSQIQQRGKEIGVRKTLGAKRHEIVIQFLIESLFLTLLAFLIALPIIYLAVPVYTNLTNTGFTFSVMMQSKQVAGVLLFVLFTGVVSGLLPAIVLSRFEPAIIIKGLINRSSLSKLARPLVTVVQFGFSTALVILALAISLQIRHLNTMDIGFNKNDLIYLNLNLNTIEDDESANVSAMLNELRQGPGIISAGMASSRPPGVGSLNPWNLPGNAEEDRQAVRHFLVDDQYINTMQFSLLAGRGFSADFTGDFERFDDRELSVEDRPMRAVVITQYQVDNFNFGTPEQAIGKIIELFGSKYQVIGVVDDFRFSGGLEDTLQSTGILRGIQEPLQNLMIRIDPAQSQQAVAWIDEVWNRHRPEVPMDREFFEQIYNDLVTGQTEGISKAAIFASFITILISSFGLYALAFYSSGRRTKEVGVRKVLGATSKSIISLLAWDFVKPVLVACVLAWGIGWYAISIYFAQFSSRVDISLVLYLIVTLGTILVAILTVASQCFKTAKGDPVISLRYE